MEQYREQELRLADLAEKGSKWIREHHYSYLEETSRGKWCGCFLAMAAVGYYGQAAKAKKKVVEFQKQGRSFYGESLAEELQIPPGLIRETEHLHIHDIPAVEIIAKLRAGELEYAP